MSSQILIKNLQQAVVHYQKERAGLESFFVGLPVGPVSLIKSLITLADPTTGIVNNTSYYELSKLLAVNPAPGRKDSGTPTKQTIRNYIQLVATVCGEHFKVITEGQTLQFLFPDIPKLFNNALKAIDVNTGYANDEFLVGRGQRSVLDGRVNTELNIEIDKAFDSADVAANKNTFKALYHTDVNTESVIDGRLTGLGKSLAFGGEVNSDLNIESNTDINTPNFAVKNINIFKTNKNKQNKNKQTKPAEANFLFSKNPKKPISADFYPTSKTIEAAQSMGFNRVTHPEVIAAFIEHNTTQRTQWSDFNQVFITWLEREAQYMQQKQKQHKASKPTRSYAHERYTHPVTPKQTALERISQHHSIATGSLWGTDDATHRGLSVSGRLVAPMDEAHSHLRTIIHQ